MSSCSDALSNLGEKEAPVEDPPTEPNKLPSVGTKIKAINNEAERTATKVIGRNFINSPTIPGQKIRGKKAAKVVVVEAIIGQAILFADRL